MHSPIRWGILGCGDVTEKKSGPAFQKVPHSCLVAVMRRDGARARDYALRHGVPRWYDDAAALLSDPDVDAVYVATPPSSHAELAIRCAAARKPTYVEKPMALTHADCERMLEAFRLTSTPLFVAYYRRALPRFIALKQGLDAGRIGTPRFVDIRLFKRPTPPAERGHPVPWRFEPTVSGGGRFVDLACHTLDVLDYLLGPITAAYGIAANQGTTFAVEDAVAASLQFSSGVLGSGAWCFTAFEPVDQVTVTGTQGAVTFSTFGTDVCWADGDGVDRMEIANPEHIQQPLIQLIVEELLGRGRCPSTGESAARTTAVMDSILADFRAR